MALLTMALLTMALLTMAVRRGACLDAQPQRAILGLTEQRQALRLEAARCAAPLFLREQVGVGRGLESTCEAQAA